MPSDSTYACFVHQCSEIPILEKFITRQCATNGCDSIHTSFRPSAADHGTRDTINTVGADDEIRNNPVSVLQDNG